ncbi:permease; transmembrane protein [Leptospira ryugenii]|uniref:Permease transmembrane protein n=1 Tax=Leptospira ryugenii TaxID=1917863 RepID=A0A2P2E4K6_9LEPT|nr:permease [Leptospira ryugenii]GBF51818.1 permease; transmembrane protein [Leptospira ryugenii]
MKFYTITRGDVDGFFGLMVDNLIQLLVLTALCTGLCGFPLPFVTAVVLPGAAVSLLIGNIFYAWQAYQIGKQQNRSDVTALPYGINTVSLFAFVFFVMFPVYQATNDYKAAWKAGLLASFLSGLIEFFGSFIAERIRKSTPRAALLSALAGIAITFISMDFLLKTFEYPLVAFLPLGIILLQYFGKVKFPLGLPGGLVSIFLGILLAFISGKLGTPIFVEGAWQRGVETVGFYLPTLSILDLFSVLDAANMKAYLAVILPMGIFNVIGSLQNIESAEASGDSFPTKTSLLVNGLGTIIGTFFGSPFPTTIYIGHPGWKGLGAKHGYSVLNGIFMSIVCFFGLMGILQALVPIEAGMAIVLWIGIVIGAQAFQATPSLHAPAVVIGLLPALAGWAVLIIQNTFFFLDRQLQTILSNQGIKAELHHSLSDIGEHVSFLPYALSGLLALSQGFLLTSMVWAAIIVFLLEKDFYRAGIWCFVGSVLAGLGLIHSYQLAGNAILNQFSILAQWQFPLAYTLLGISFFLTQFFTTGSFKKRT